MGPRVPRMVFVAYDLAAGIGPLSTLGIRLLLPATAGGEELSSRRAA